MKNIVSSILLFLTTLVSGQTVYTDLNKGRLRSQLEGNSQDIRNVAHVTLNGTIAPTYRIHIAPGGTPTTISDGIGWGSDVVLYRSATGTMTLSGNLAVVGSITSTATPFVQSTGAYTWTGNQVWSGNQTWNGAVNTVGTAGLVFTGSGAANTRTALSLVAGVNVQAYDVDLATIAGFSSPADGLMMVGNGTIWTTESGATLRTSIGLGTANAASFASLTTTGVGSFGGAITITSGDLTLSAGALKPSTALAPQYGGTGMNNSALVADRLLYTTGTGTFSAGTLTAFGRSLIDDADASAARTTLGLALGTNVQAFDADLAAIAGHSATNGNIMVFTGGTWTSQNASTARTTLGLGTSAVLNVPASGNATATEVVKGSDTRLHTTASGDLVGTYPSPTLAASGVVAGTYGDADTIPVITVDNKGRIIGAVSTGITFPNPELGVDTIGDYVVGVLPGVGIAVSGSGGEGSTPTVGLQTDSVALGTYTTGNYVAGITAGTGITVTTGVGEGVTPTVAITTNGHDHTSANITDATPDGYSNHGDVLRTDSNGTLLLGKLGLGSDTYPTTALLHLAPGSEPITSASGMKFGSDVSLYRSGTNTLKVSGLLDVVTSATIPILTVGTSASINSLTTTGVTTVPDLRVGTYGITFTGSGASVTRTQLGLVIGTNVQAWDADLDTFAALAKTNGNFIMANGSAWVVKTSAEVMTQLNAQAADTELTELAATNPMEGDLLRANGAGTWVEAPAITVLGSLSTVSSLEAISVNTTLDAETLKRYYIQSSGTNITLPLIADVDVGTMLTVKRESAAGSSPTLTSADGSNIAGTLNPANASDYSHSVLTFTIPSASVTIVSDGLEWQVVDVGVVVLSASPTYGPGVSGN